MSIYELPKQLGAPKFPWPRFFKSPIFWAVILSIIISSLVGFAAGLITTSLYFEEIKEVLARLNIEIPSPKVIEKEIVKEYIPQTSQEEKIIQVVKNVSPAVVSIAITKDIKVLEEIWISPFEEFPFQIPEYRERIEKRKIGGGTGFIVSAEGMILTNKHVVLDKEADYTVFTSDGQKFPAKVLARDPFQDLALIKIEREKGVDREGKLISKPFPTIKLGDSDKLQIGQTVIAIGYALGEFQNTVSVGVVSGLKRTITASGDGLIEVLKNLIQTDAAINKGNSGGPLLNLNGEVIGVNVAIAEPAENIGFAIPINQAKRDIEQVKALGKIVYPFLGVRWTLITPELKKEKNLLSDYGALITKGSGGEGAIFPGSAAEKAGLKEGDIILEFDCQKITSENPLDEIIVRYNPGDKVILKILRNGQEKTVEVTLGERSE